MIIVTNINDAEVDITNNVIGWLNATPSAVPEFENSKYLVVTHLLFFTNCIIILFF